MIINNITKKPIFWISFIIVAILCILITIKYFSNAFSIINIDIKMDRASALEQAKNITSKYNLGPKDFKQAISFDCDNGVKTYAELECGGKDAFMKMIKDDLYQPYTWTIRSFKEKDINEAYVRFTNLGTPYGFKEIISDDKTGPDLSKEEAQKIAEKEITQNWNISLNIFKLIESSKEIKPSKRSDHLFVYERIDKKLVQVKLEQIKPENIETQNNGESGYYRLRVMVSGDKITEISHFVKIPESFSNKYREMRAYNTSIANTASFIMIILYIILGCLVGLYFVFRKNYLLFKAPLLLALFISTLSFFENINSLPSAWMNYNTVSSSTNFLINYLISALFGFLYKFFLLALTFMAAESLTRLAFGNHISLWSALKEDNASSKQITGRTIAGYLLAAIFLAYDTIMYLFATKYLGWWSPSDALADPNIMANYAPWLNPFFISIHAGFWEECLFRAVPLACAALIGKKFGHKKGWLIFAFILQAIIFGAAHANYAQQPSYARLAELIIPSFMFAIVYLSFGLIPSIITHYTYDLILTSIPLFLSTSKYAFLNQIIIIILGLIPIILILISRIKNGKWTDIKEKYLNKNWIPTPKINYKIFGHEEIKQTKINISKKTTYLLLLFGAIGTTLFFYFTPFKHDAKKINITQEQAIKIALEKTNELGLNLNNWTALPILAESFDYRQYIGKPKAKLEKPSELMQHKFIWQHDKNLYKKLLGSYLNPPQWIVQFVRFSGSPLDRAEEYTVFLNDQNNIYRIYHKIPEDFSPENILINNKETQNLDQEKAREIAISHISKNMKLDSKNLKEIAAKSNKLKNRTNWKFIFSDLTALQSSNTQPENSINKQPQDKPTGDSLNRPKLETSLKNLQKIKPKKINNAQKINDSKTKINNLETRIVIHIDGNEISDAYKYVNIPEEWVRNEKNKNNILGILEKIFYLLNGLVLIILSMIAGLKARLSIKNAIAGFIICFIANVIISANSIQNIISGFDPIKPFNLQIMTFLWSFLISVFFSCALFAIILGLFSGLKSNFYVEKKYNLIICAISIGLIIAGINALLNYFRPSILPIWPDFDGLQGYIPTLNSITKSIIRFTRTVGITTILIFSINYIYNHKKPKNILSLILILITVGNSIAISDFSMLNFWIIKGLIISAISFLLYILFIHKDLRFIPTIYATIAFTSIIQEIAFNPHPYAIFENITRIIIIILITIFLTKKLNTLQDFDLQKN